MTYINRPLNRIVFTLLAVFVLAISQPSATDLDDQAEQMTNKVFPLRDTYYSFEEFRDGVLAILANSLHDDFNNGWGALYAYYDDPTTKSSRLPPNTETMHIRCMYKDLYLTQDDEEMQRINLYSRLLGKGENHTHMKILNEKTPVLVEKLKTF